MKVTVLVLGLVILLGGVLFKEGIAVVLGTLLFIGSITSFSKPKHRNNPPTNKRHLNDSKRRDDLTEAELLALQETIENYLFERFNTIRLSGVSRYPKIGEVFLINHISCREDVSKRLVRKALKAIVVDYGSPNYFSACFVGDNKAIWDLPYPHNKKNIGPGPKFEEKIRHRKNRHKT